MKGGASKLWGVCILGIALSLVLAGAIAFLSYYTGWNDFSEQGNFFREIRKFDALLRETPEITAGRMPERLNAMLDRLEKKAIGVETHLSVLKRRRELAMANQARFQSAYREAAEKAALAFPFSGHLTALAADALILEYPDQFSPEIQTKLRQYTGLLPDPPLNSLALDISVLLGDLSNPVAAAALPRGGEFLSLGVSSLDGLEREGFLVNSVLLSLLEKDMAAANSRIVSLISSGDISQRALRFGAEYFYDTNPLRAAELFSQFPDAPSLGRLADSLWLADFRESAVEIWTLLVSPVPEPRSPGVEYGAIPQDLRVRSLYNLASVSTEEQKKLGYYRELFREVPGHVQGIIGYSRLFDRDQAESILTEQTPGQALLDLELLRRRLEGWEIRRTVAETWLLLGRYPGEEGIYRWGAWYFDRQRQFPETALLLRQARMNGIDAPVLVLHDVFRLIREGLFVEAEALLAERVENASLWQIPANLGLIAESRRSLFPALDYYGRAASLTKNRLSEARVRLRIARCLRMLGRDGESRRELEHILELDPENLNARLEMRRLDL
jgi:tetratricopeptide (TPR) repeat protein